MKNQGKIGYNQLEGVSAERLAAFLGISDSELYLLKTKNRCCLLPPFHQRTEQLLISRTYMKALQLRFNFI